MTEPRRFILLILTACGLLMACAGPVRLPTPQAGPLGQSSPSPSATRLERPSDVPSATAARASALPSPAQVQTPEPVAPESIPIVVGNKPDFTGIWGIWGSSVNKIGKPWYKGHLVTLGWDDIEKADNHFDWKVLDRKLTELTSAGLYVMVMVYSGRQNPAWLYSTGVPSVTNTFRGESTFAYYLNDNNGDGDGDDVGEFRYYFKRMISNVAQHLNQLNSDHTLSTYHKIVGIQGPIGSSGDPHPYSQPGTTTGVGDPWWGEGTPYLITEKPWQAYQKEMFSFYYQQYQDFSPRLHVLLNTGDSKAMHDWALAELPEIWVKLGWLGDRYQSNKEYDVPDASSGSWLWEPVRELRGGIAHRSRSEMDFTNAGWFQQAPLWNMYWTNLWDLHAGMDMHNIMDTDLENPAYVEAFSFFTKYAGYKDPGDSVGVWIALRDGLDMGDTQRFPESEFGREQSGKNQQRYRSILNQFAPFGARQDDLTIGNKTSWTAMNDIGWRIYAGNYQMWLYQKDPNETSQGLWRVGPQDQEYGRFARRFDTSSGKTNMYFDIDDRFFFKHALSGSYPVALRVVYLDQGTGTWSVHYDSVDDANKTAMMVTNTNSGRWKEQTITLEDGNFNNRADNASDIILTQVSGDDTTFHMLELTRATGFRTDSTEDSDALAPAGTTR